jgi:hypothetical protein
MGTYTYVSVDSLPLTTEDSDIYVEAIVSAMENEAEPLPFLLLATLNDIRRIMSKQYAIAKEGGFSENLPTGSVSIFESAEKTVKIKLANSHGTVISNITINGSPTLRFLKRDLNSDDLANLVKAHYGGSAGLYFSEGDMNSSSTKTGKLVAIPNATKTSPGSAYELKTAIHTDTLFRPYYEVDISLKKTHNTYDANGVILRTWYTYEYSRTVEVPLDDFIVTQATEDLDRIENIIVVSYIINSDPQTGRHVILPSGSINLEPVTQDFGDYYPIFPIKVDFVFANTDPNTATAADIDLEYFYKKYSLGKLDYVIDGFKEVKDSSDRVFGDVGYEDNIDDIYLVNGINIYSNFSGDNKYVYTYFKNLSESFSLSGFSLTENQYTNYSQINIISGQFNYTMMFRGINIVDTNPTILDTDKVTYEHSWVDNLLEPNVFLVKDATTEDTVAWFVKDANKFWSNNVYKVSKLVNGSEVASISIKGLQAIHRIYVLETDAIKISDLIPSGNLQDDYNAFNDLTDLEKEEKDAVKLPKVMFIPLNQTFINNGVVEFSNRELRGLFLRSFHYIIYGSQVNHVHWSRELRAFVLEAIALALTMYQIASLGAGIGAAVAKKAVFKYLLKQGAVYLLKASAKAILVEVFGKSKGEAIFNVAAIAYSTQAGISSNTSFISDSLNITMAVLNTKGVFDHYKIQQELLDREEVDTLDVSEDIGLLESPSDFLSRTTNGALKDMASKHLIQPDLIKTMNAQNTIYPNFRLDEFDQGE